METVYLALRVLLSLAVVLGLLWMVQRRLTRGGRMPGATKQINVVTRQVIAPKASVVVLDVDGKRFLLGVTEQSVTVLNTSDSPVPSSLPEALERGPIRSIPRKRSAERTSGSAAFARVMSDLAGTKPNPAAPIAYLPRGNRRADGSLDGSILSPATWKRTAAALRRER